MSGKQGRVWTAGQLAHPGGCGEPGGDPPCAVPGSPPQPPAQPAADRRWAVARRAAVASVAALRPAVAAAAAAATWAAMFSKRCVTSPAASAGRHRIGSTDSTTVVVGQSEEQLLEGPAENALAAASSPAPAASGTEARTRLAYTGDPSSGEPHANGGSSSCRLSSGESKGLSGASPSSGSGWACRLHRGSSCSPAARCPPPTSCTR